jgi:two-component system, NarL family, nitrate/nitrite response regulator NarL
MVQLLVVHEARIFCRVITAALRQESDIRVVGSATTAEEVMSQIHLCNTVLICATLPDNGALSLTKNIRQTNPAVKILIMGLPRSEEAILQHIEAGADGYVLQDDSMHELLRNIQAIQRGEALASPQVVAALMARLASLAELQSTSGPDATRLEALTPREREVLALLGQGYSNQDVSDKLTIELGTVKNHVHNILQKLGVNNRWEAIAYAELLARDVAAPPAKAQ